MSLHRKSDTEKPVFAECQLVMPGKKQHRILN
jgi:hypothetical protein